MNEKELRTAAKAVKDFICSPRYRAEYSTHTIRAVNKLTGYGIPVLYIWGDRIMCGYPADCYLMDPIPARRTMIEKLIDALGVSFTSVSFAINRRTFTIETRRDFA